MKTSRLLLALSGLALAVPPAPPVKKGPAPLTTMQWFEKQIRDKRLDQRCATLMQRKLPTESFDELLSHVGIWFAKWGSTGHCDEYLAKGHPPAVSTLMRWLNNKWAQYQYKLGKDALNRNQGRRTQCEMRCRKDSGAEDYILEAYHDPAAPLRVWQYDSENKGEVIMDFMDTTPAPLEPIDQKEMDLVEDIMHIRRAKAGARYTRYLDLLLNGATKEEVAEQEGVTMRRANNVYQKVRDDLKKSPIMISVALKVLDLVSEEPWSTLTEIEATLTSEGWEEQALVLETTRVGPKALKKTVGKALTLLSQRGLISEGRGQAFAPTPQGRVVLDKQSMV
jgi:hypothetical protein